MFLSDAVAVHPKMRSVCNHHEQASAMAAVGYAKYSEGIGVCFTSTGCGATNAMTGLLDAWQDNVPVVFVSGQVKRKETTHNAEVPLRQIGTQEANIIALVKPITKYAVMVNEPEEIAYHLEKALYLARTGRPGPVWIDVPMDVQGATIDVRRLRKFDPREIKDKPRLIPAASALKKLEKMLERSERPVIIAGQGIRLAGALSEFKQFVEKYQIPVVSPYLGVGLLPTGHRAYIGVIGTKASRSGNLAMQNADLVISIGSRLSVTAIGYEYELFAREAKKVVIDIDPGEHKKKTIKIDLFIEADAKEFLKRFKPKRLGMISKWNKACSDWKKKYPVCLPEYRKYKGHISMYHLVDTLSRLMKPDAVVVSDAGSAFYVTTQAINLRANQRYLTSGGQADMGFTVPAAIGAAVAKRGEVFGITGDGSFQLNIQELQTIVHNRLPVKIVVLNNNGYLSIRATQNKFFEGRLIGTGPESGVSMPDLKKIARAYGIKHFLFKNSATLERDLKKAMSEAGPALFEVICPPNEPVVPAVSSMRMPDGRMVSRPLEDMLPFLDRDEYRSNLFIKPVD